MTRGRGLRPGDLEVWHRVARTVRARDGTRVKPGPESVDAPKTPAKSSDSLSGSILPVGFKLGAMPRSEFSSGSGSGKTESFPPPLRMDAKAHAALKKGKLDPEARLDLHGMTFAQAHQALTGFIGRTHSQGKRLVLVITGKGKERLDHNAIPSHLGLLRFQVPRWLQMSPLDHHVLQVTQAHPRHGGEGALYVYLRKGR